MEKKVAFIALAIIALLILSGLAIESTFALPVVSLTPAVVPTQSLTIGSTFQLAVHVDGISNLWAWKISVAWNPAVLQMDGSPVEGPFLKSGGLATVFLPSTPNNTAGVLYEQASTRLSATGVSGSGDVATLKFKVIGYGSSNIDMNSTMKEYGSAGNHPDIPCTTVGATFSLQDSNPPPPPPPPPSGSYGPKAVFSPANGTVFFKGETIILDASSSTAGYDTGGVNETCPIINYAWRVEYPNGTAFNSFSGQTVSFKATIIGAFRIILIVTAQDPTSPSAPSFVSTDTDASIILIEDSAQAVLDVFTNIGGVGSNVNCSAFGPQELIKVYALVSFHNVAVANKDVAFEIKNPSGTVIGMRVARTNSSGYAYVDFRLPWADPPSTSFGFWSITGSVDVSQVVLTDTVSFAYNYILTVDSIRLPASTKRETSIPINVTLNSISDLSILSRLAITIYDEAKVPVGFFTVEKTNIAKGKTTIHASILIPGWAFTGQATVYVAVLTDFPDKGGVSYSQEMSANFQIQP